MAELLERAAALVAIPSVSRAESSICDALEATLAGAAHLDVVRIGNNLVARTNFGAPRRLVLAGHLDTVPPAGNERPRVDGDRLFGLGAADMKGGLAVMEHLALEVGAAGVDCTYVFYACEEIARADSGLLEIDAARPGLLGGDAAVLLEPTSVRVEAGCQGVVRARVRVGGRRAHSARPWTGTNAIHRCAAVLARIASFPERRIVLDGCEYRESLQAVRVGGGVAGNVIPDEVEIVASHRFAPDRDTEEAFSSVRDHLAAVLDPALGDAVTLEDSAPAAPPGLGHPLLARLVEASGESPRAKLGWTDVAFFHERAIPAANFGPGDGLLAHTAGEFVTRDELERACAQLHGLITAPEEGLRACAAR